MTNDLTVANILAAQEYAEHKQRVLSARNTEQAHAERRHGSAYGKSIDTAAVLQEYVDGARIPEFDLTDANTVVSAVMGLGGFRTGLFNLGKGSFQQNIIDDWTSSYFNEVAFVWYTAEGKFYAGHVRHERILASDYESGLDVFLYALRTHHQKLMQERENSLVQVNKARAQANVEPLAHWMDLEFIGRKHGIPEH